MSAIFRILYWDFSDKDANSYLGSEFSMHGHWKKETVRKYVQQSLRRKLKQKRMKKVCVIISIMTIFSKWLHFSWCQNKIYKFKGAREN